MSSTDMTVYDAETGEELAVAPTATAAIVRSEVEAQLSAAHRFPRSFARAFQRAKEMATATEQIAESCVYSLARAGKPIVGPSVRLAEIASTAWGNLRVAAQVVDVGERDLTARGVCWDLENNLQAAVEVKRRIIDRNGRRYNDDMVVVTGNAACSIARRNAILQVVPRSLVDEVYRAAADVATGKGKPLAERRAKAVAAFAAIGIDKARLLNRLGRAGIDDLTEEDLEILSGLRTAIREGMSTEEAFPVSDAPAVPPPVSTSDRAERIARKREQVASTPAAAASHRWEDYRAEARRTDGIRSEDLDALVATIDSREAWDALEPTAQTEALERLHGCRRADGGLL